MGFREDSGLTVHRDAFVNKAVPSQLPPRGTALILISSIGHSASEQSIQAACPINAAVLRGL